jgi:hypothetical protein
MLRIEDSSPLYVLDNVNAPITSNQTYLKKDVIIVPEWIFRCLIRNKLNYMDLFDYSRLSAVLATSDILELVATNILLTKLLFSTLPFANNKNNIDLIEPPMSLALVEEWQQSFSFQKSGLGSIIYNYDYLKSYENSIKTKLTSEKIENFSLETDLKSCYSIHTGPDKTVFMLVKPGIIERHQNIDFLKILCESLLTEFYRLYPMHVCSTVNNIFSKYVSLL